MSWFEAGGFSSQLLGVLFSFIGIFSISPSMIFGSKVSPNSSRIRSEKVEKDHGSCTILYFDLYNSFRQKQSTLCMKKKNSLEILYETRFSCKLLTSNCLFSIQRKETSYLYIYQSCSIILKSINFWLITNS